MCRPGSRPAPTMWLMDFDLTDVQKSWQQKGASLGRELADDPSAARVVMAASRVGLLDPEAQLLAVALAVEAMAHESSASAVVFALHCGSR